ncbi:unnamed protein product [marine sediment metagenome]|uniref:Uncharacterized protein n=1 Tax=marine sediment metagenome TaxID=412755 RepID=X1K3E5_9ZZZZ
MDDIKRKILGIFVCMLLISTIPVIGITVDEELKEEMIVNDYSVGTLSISP